MTNEILSVLILTRNEEVHIARCLESAFRLSKSVFVLDSNSTDRTPEIVSSTKATLISGNFSSLADKLNWGLENIQFNTPWVLRLDADEILSEELIAQAPLLLHSLKSDVVGVYVRRQLWFMGTWIRFGGMYPTYSMRLVRPESVFCESRDLDEHIILRHGRYETWSADVKDIPLTDLSTWIAKHNHYATLEARSRLRERPDTTTQEGFMDLFGALPQRVRWIKARIFYRLPPFLRPFFYFMYRYFLRLGFLDGLKGFIFHFMHGLWYRVLVDAKIIEGRQKLRRGRSCD